MSDDLLFTPLNDLHIELGAKMVPFAGYNMPVQYADGIKKEHLHTRAAAGLFDVSHMGQVVVSGEGAAKALEALVPVELEALPINKQTYAVFTDEQGGILDDLIITRWADDSFFLVVNAACKEQDIAHLKAGLAGFNLDVLDRGLLALQGPKAEAVMAALEPKAAGLTFMNGCNGAIDGVECFITRSGYTGEDGFEISIPAQSTVQVAKVLLAQEGVKPIGLGARDSLRLEAGLCLYGHDLSIETSPIEAALSWSISKSRRADGDKAGGFPGADTILSQMTDGPGRKRVGLQVNGKAPVREGAEIQDNDGNVVGTVTSGGFGPSVDAPIAMGYVSAEHAAIGTELQAIVRDKPRSVTVAKLPFVQQTYKR